MGEDYIQLPPDSTGKKLRTFKRVVGANEVHEEIITIVDPTTGNVIDVRDVIDRATRLLGKVYGTQDIIQQRPTTKELIVQISHQGTEKDPTQIRSLTATDEVTIADIKKVATPISIIASNAGDNGVGSPPSGKKYKVKLIDTWNGGTADVVIHFKFTAAGDAHFKKLLAPKSGYVVNLVGANWEGGVNETLYCVLDVAGTVYVTVMVEAV